jgi:hypothetical protein
MGESVFSESFVEPVVLTYLPILYFIKIIARRDKPPVSEFMSQKFN